MTKRPGGKGLAVGVKDWPSEERPRERLFQLGAGSLSDGELVAVLLGGGRSGKSAVDLGRELVAPGWEQLADRGAAELMAVEGVGPARAAVLVAAFEVGRRLRRSGAIRRAIRSGDDVANLVGDEMARLPQEQFRVVLVDARQQVMAVETPFIGGLTSVEVHPREVFRAAVRVSAAGVMLVHNHPTGDPTPSRDDRLLTKRLAQAGDVLGIPVLDHVVIGRGRHVSFRELGFLGEPG